MDIDLRDVHKHMLKLGIAALSHANNHANYLSYENDMWAELSVLQAAHAAEILIKARIAQEHPLLIFEKIPRSTQVEGDFLDFEDLAKKAKTIQFSELPERLWAATGIKLKNIHTYKSFGYLRNSIQHFASPLNIDCSDETVRFIYEVIDPFIYDCWGVCAIDCNEDYDPYIYLIEPLISREVLFLVSHEAAEYLKNNNFRFPSDPMYKWPDNPKYKAEMLKRFKEDGLDLESDSS